MRKSLISRLIGVDQVRSVFFLSLIVVLPGALAAEYHGLFVQFSGEWEKFFLRQYFNLIAVYLPMTSDYIFQL